MSVEAKSNKSALKGTVVLLVEDSPDDAFMVQRALKQAGVAQQVIHLRDGEEAVNYLSGRPPYDDRDKFPVPALVLLDLKMPRLTGLDVLTWLQGRPDLARVPVVVLTGSVRTEDRNEAQKRGAVGYQVKPVVFEDLVEMVRQVNARWLGDGGCGGEKLSGGRGD
jgi:CheY-like chemotaxis protein